MTKRTRDKRGAAISALFTLAIFSAFWAYTIIDNLIRGLHKDVTFVDLGAIFVLGLICGAGLSLVYALKSGKNA